MMKRFRGSCTLVEKIAVGVYTGIVFLLGTFCVPCNIVGMGTDAEIKQIAFRPLWYINNIYLDQHYTYQFNIMLALYLLLVLTILLLCVLFILRKRSEKAQPAA